MTWVKMSFHTSSSLDYSTNRGCQTLLISSFCRLISFWYNFLNAVSFKLSKWFLVLSDIVTTIFAKILKPEISNSDLKTLKTRRTLLRRRENLFVCSFSCFEITETSTCTYFLKFSVTFKAACQRIKLTSLLTWFKNIISLLQRHFLKCF